MKRRYGDGMGWSRDKNGHLRIRIKMGVENKKVDLVNKSRQFEMRRRYRGKITESKTTIPEKKYGFWK